MATQLNYDSQGFIVGIGRIQSNTQGISHDTQTIIDLLKKQNDTAQKQMADNLREMQRTLASQSYNGQSASTNRTSNGRSSESIPHSNQSRSTNLNIAHMPPVGRMAQEFIPQNSQSSPSRDYNRDSGGRFTAQAENDSFLNKLSEKLGEALSTQIDNSNLDPLIDSYNEMRDMLSPVTGMVGGIWNKAKERRQRKHDKKVEDELEDIAENTANNQGSNLGGGSGLLGGMGGLLGKGAGLAGGLLMGGLGLLGKGGKGLFGLLKKGGGKGLGLLGTLIGAGSLAMDWDNLDHAGKSEGVGSLAGGLAGASLGAMIGTAIFPGVGTVVGGLIGGYLGSEGGGVIGKVASPYIQSWSQSLSNANLPKKFTDIFSSGLEPLFKFASGVWDWLKQKSQWLVEQAKSLYASATTNADGSPNFIGSMINGVQNFFGGGGGKWDGRTGGGFKGFGSDVDGYIQEASQRYGMDEKTLRGFVKMESGWTGAMSPTGAIGTGQFIKGTWDGLAKSPEGQAIGMTTIGSRFRTKADPRFNKRVNTLATALLAKKNAETLQRNGLPVTGENLYMLHNIGDGVIPALKGSNNVSSDTLTAMRKNGMTRGMSATDFVKRQKSIFNMHYRLANGTSSDATKPTAIAPKVNAPMGATGATAMPLSMQKPNNLTTKTQPSLLDKANQTLSGLLPTAITTSAKTIGNALPKLPDIPMLTIPIMPTIHQRLDSGNDDENLQTTVIQPLVNQANNRGLAHAVGTLSNDRFGLIA